VNYYVVKAIASDGSTLLSNTVALSQNAELSVQIYPNPSSDFVSISFFANTEENALVRVTDLNGKVLQLVNCTTKVGENIIKVDMQEFASGTYYFTIRLPEGIEQAHKVQKH
jgi:hypothetical protein